MARLTSVSPLFAGFSLSFFLVTIVPFVSAAGISAKDVKHVVFFGDSYTDQSRSHSISNGTFPGKDYQEVYPPTDVSANGGFQWPWYFRQYTGISFDNYATGGAVCSQRLTPFLTVPDVSGGQLAWFVQDHVLKNATPQHAATLDISGSSTLAVIWIGTNDLGIHSLLDPNASAPYIGNVPPLTPAIPPLAPGSDNATTLLDLADCQLDTFRALYRDYGLRKFLVMAIAPLHLTRLYAPIDSGTIYWPDTHDGKSWNRQMFQMVNAVNSFLKAGVKTLQREFGRGGGSVEYFDTYRFFEELYLHPTKFFNGSIPANVTGNCHQCPNASDFHFCGIGDCTMSQRDSYMFWDELHPSEQTGRLLAREVKKKLDGRSVY